MILYLDSSALVKQYVAERGSAEVSEVIAGAQVIGTALISRPEVAAALAKAVRTGALAGAEASACLRRFREDWTDLIRVQISEPLIARADAFAWDYGLRGYDAVHLAAAALWQDAMADAVAFSTFDRQLWHAAGRAGLEPHPADLPALLDSWRAVG